MLFVGTGPRYVATVIITAIHDDILDVKQIAIDNFIYICELRTFSRLIWRVVGRHATRAPRRLRGGALANCRCCRAILHGQSTSMRDVDRFLLYLNIVYRFVFILYRYRRLIFFSKDKCKKYILDLHI